MKKNQKHFLPGRAERKSKTLFTREGGALAHSIDQLPLGVPLLEPLPNYKMFIWLYINSQINSV